MSRPFFLPFRLPGRGEKSSSDAHEAAYALSEAERDDAFRSSQNEFQQEFAEEERVQAEGEQAREEEFDQMMDKFNQAFGTDYQRWERSFLEADARQEDVFEKNEAGRQTFFLEGQASRTITFDKEQDARSKRSEWHSAARAVLFEQGRQARKSICATIDDVLTDQYKKLLVSQEESFIFQEGRRDDIVRSLLDDKRGTGTSSLMSNESTNDEPVVRFPVPMARDRESSPVVIYPPARSESRSSTYNRRSRSPSPVSPVSHRQWYTRSRSRSPPIIIQPPPVRMRSPSARSSLNSVKDEDDGGVKKARQGNEGPFEERFMSAQEQRSEAFLAEEQHRESRFQNAEGQREVAEDQRSDQFAEKEQTYANRALDLSEFQKKHFDSREQSRGGKDTQRDEVFKASQQRRSHAFDLTILQIEEQVEVEKDHEKSLVDQLKHTTELLSQRQIAQLEMARTKQAARFRESQKRRETELSGLTPTLPRVSEPQHHIPIPVAMPSAPRMYPHPQPQIIVPPRHSMPSQVGVPMRPSRSSSPRRRYSHTSRRWSPPTGFAGAALLRGPIIQGSLPIPGLDDVTNKELRQEIGFQNLQRRRRLLFERSQNKRQEKFEKNTQKRRHTFTVKEMKRKTTFQKKQRERKASFEKQQDERNTTFREAQQNQERQFQEAEHKREDDFHQRERSRDSEFKSAERARATQFQEKMRQVQKQCFEDERRRTEELERWGARLIHKREESQKQAYEAAEAERAAIFEQSLGAFVFRNNGRSRA